MLFCCWKKVLGGGGERGMEFCNYKVGRRILRQYFFLKPAIAIQLIQFNQEENTCIFKNPENVDYLGLFTFHYLGRHNPRDMRT